MIKYRLAKAAGVSLGAASTLLLGKNEARKRAILVNGHATQSVWLAFGEAAVVGKGVYLAPNGGSFEIPPDELWTGEVYGIASGAATPVGTEEFS